MTTKSGPFDWSGGHPALDLVNTLDERPSQAPVENLAVYCNLVRFTEAAGLIGSSVAANLRPLDGPACANALRGAQKLRESLYAVLTANEIGRPIKPAALDAIALQVRRAHAARTFVSTSRSGVVAQRWISPASPEVPLHACALAIESLLVSADWSRIRKCCADDCEVFFLDTSKARRRQWCSMQNCGNRAKQRRWRRGQE
ncbi:CGNR zinc finger domain-containing protein [Bradyrhizobium guangdongense]|uniref:CGNR zinc finger domain-containing protein n=1 Tax=Bradyrhizobium guangdongense TaxID=1325090 RepID=UPI0016424D07|nr:CGNR zinc finger domain-containing protein [Bradyrhizobium guangdongense]